MPRNPLPNFTIALVKVLGQDAKSQDDDGNSILRKDRRREYEVTDEQAAPRKEFDAVAVPEADLLKLRQMDEEDEQNYGFVNLICFNL